MAKDQLSYRCGDCGYQTAKWMGKCPQCGAWNTLIEERRLPTAAAGTRKQTEKAARLTEIPADSETRLPTGIGELDRVLGGGLIDGMVVLLGGDPGIGKSTLLLQVTDRLSAYGTVLYVSGEESKAQIKRRAARLHVTSDPYLYCETSLDDALAEAERLNARFLIVDSVQTLLCAAAETAAGTVTQVRTVTTALTRYAKSTGTIVFIVGHVTKEGAIAGPKVLEHIVDTVLYFEGDRAEGLRLLRTEKNRYGSTNEIGVFDMRDDGMHEVQNPSALFLSGSNSVGCAVTCVVEGSRPLLLEVQSLLCPTLYGSPRRTAIGPDVGRINVLLAVLERKAHLRFSDKDVYCNIAGQLRLFDRSADLAIALCLASSLLDIALPPHTAAIGEIGLTGEVRVASRMDARVNECVRLGYTNLLVPKRASVSVTGATLIPVTDVCEALAAVLTNKG